MQTLFVLDEKNYTDNMPVIERYAVRAIIKRDNLFAVQLSKDGEYKIPGGGVEQGESKLEALIREVKEETGLLVKPNTIIEIGKIEEIRQDILCETKKYVQHSFIYKCEVFQDTTKTNMTDNELEKGYKLVWESALQIYKTNLKLQGTPWIDRDTNFFELLINNKIKL